MNQSGVSWVRNIWMINITHTETAGMNGEVSFLCQCGISQKSEEDFQVQELS